MAKLILNEDLTRLILLNWKVQRIISTGLSMNSTFIISRVDLVQHQRHTMEECEH